MKINIFLRRLFFIILPSLVISLVILEAGLRIAGFLYTKDCHIDKYKISKELTSNSFNILCVGDSYTYGLGASHEYNYPEQLSKMLNENNIMGLIKVQNLGSPGGNSYRILRIFRENINRYNPVLVIAMVGMNNYWNLEGKQSFPRNPILGKLNLDIHSLRLYKLFKIIKINLQNKALVNNYSSVDADIPKQESYEKNMQFYRETGRSDLAIKETTDLIGIYPNRYELKARLTTLLREDGKYDLALRNAKKTLEQISLNSKASAYLHLELVYIYRAKKLWDLARKEIDYAVQDISIIQSVFPELRNICNQDSNLDFNQEIQKIRCLIHTIHGKKGTDVLDSLLYLENNKDERERVLKADLLNFIDIAMKNNIKLVFMTYPFDLWVNEIIRNTATKHSIILVDNETIFKSEKNRERYFNLDGHCNELGYRLIAQNLYIALKTKIFTTGIK